MLKMVIRQNGPFDDMALDEMVLDEMSCSDLVLYRLPRLKR